MHFIFCKTLPLKNGLFLETHNTECYNQDVKRRVDRSAILLNRDKVHLIKFRSIRLKINRCCVISLAQYTYDTHGFFVECLMHMGHLLGKPTMCFSTRSDTNRAVQTQKRARILKFWI